MVRKQQFIFASVVIILAILACKSSANPAPTLGTEPTKPAEIIPPSELPAATAGPDNGSLLNIPSGFLADPNTACAINGSDALSCLEGNGWHIYEKSAFNPAYIPEAIGRCPDGRTYISTSSEIYQIKGKIPVALGDAYAAKTIACGSANEIWTGDMEGVSHFDGTTWTRYLATDIFGTGGSGGSEIVYSMAVAPNGNAWATTDKNIATFDGTGWKVLTPPGDNLYLMSYDQRRGLFVDTQGDVWAIAQNDGGNQLLKYDGIQWSTFPGPRNENITLIVVDHENRVWLATSRNQIYTLDTQTKSWSLQFGTRQFGAGDSSALNAMRFDGQDRLWVATDYGLDVFNGATWTTYHMHTADLYANNISDILIFGDGPQLPDLEKKAPGSVRGRLVGQTSTGYKDSKVEICLKPETPPFSGDTPCADQAYHALTTVDADGNFVFTNIPAGRYYLMVKVSSSWGHMIKSGSSQLLSDKSGEFEVNLGAETQLGEIITR